MRHLNNAKILATTFGRQHIQMLNPPTVVAVCYFSVTPNYWLWNNALYLPILLPRFEELPLTIALIYVQVFFCLLSGYIKLIFLFP